MEGKRPDNGCRERNQIRLDAGLETPVDSDLQASLTYKHDQPRQQLPSIRTLLDQLHGDPHGDGRTPLEGGPVASAAQTAAQQVNQAMMSMQTTNVAPSMLPGSYGMMGNNIMSHLYSAGTNAEVIQSLWNAQAQAQLREANTSLFTGNNLMHIMQGTPQMQQGTHDTLGALLALTTTPNQQQSSEPSGTNPHRSGSNKRSSKVLNEWFFRNISHPYPTQEEKETLAEQTGMSLTQINNWFGNKRIRFKRKVKKERSMGVSASEIVKSMGYDVADDEVELDEEDEEDERHRPSRKRQRVHFDNEDGEHEDEENEERTKHLNMAAQMLEGMRNGNGIRRTSSSSAASTTTTTTTITPAESPREAADNDDGEDEAEEHDGERNGDSTTPRRSGRQRRSSQRVSSMVAQALMYEEAVSRRSSSSSTNTSDSTKLEDAAWLHRQKGGKFHKGGKS